MNSIVVHVVLLLLLVAQTAFAQTTKNTQLADMVTRMAKIGRASSPTFSPDGTRLAFVSDQTGVPQVWVIAIDGGAPLQVTKGADPVGRVILRHAASADRKARRSLASRRSRSARSVTVE